MSGRPPMDCSTTVFRASYGGYASTSYRYEYFFSNLWICFPQLWIPLPDLPMVDMLIMAMGIDILLLATDMDMPLPNFLWWICFSQLWIMVMLLLSTVMDIFSQLLNTAAPVFRSSALGFSRLTACPLLYRAMDTHHGQGYGRQQFRQTPKTILSF